MHQAMRLGDVIITDFFLVTLIYPLPLHNPNFSYGYDRYMDAYVSYIQGWRAHDPHSFH
jgi:hypothetical protein